MYMRTWVALFLASIAIACGEASSRSGNVENGALNSNESKKNVRYHFDAIDILGKTSLESEKTIGKPYLITGESKSDPTLKSRWYWYKYEKDLSVFFDRDEMNDTARTVTLIFDNKPKDALEAAWILGIRLNGHKPIVTNSGSGLQQYTYKDLQDKGRNFEVQFFKSVEGDDTLKILLR
jgi:hypothetical protein